MARDPKRYFYIQAQKKKNLVKAIYGSDDEIVKYFDKPLSMEDLDVYRKRERVKSNNAVARDFGGKIEKMPTYPIFPKVKKK